MSLSSPYCCCCLWSRATFPILCGWLLWLQIYHYYNPPRCVCCFIWNILPSLHFSFLVPYIIFPSHLHCTNSSPLTTDWVVSVFWYCRFYPWVNVNTDGISPPQGIIIQILHLGFVFRLLKCGDFEQENPYDAFNDFSV